MLRRSPARLNAAGTSSPVAVGLALVLFATAWAIATPPMNPGTRAAASQGDLVPVLDLIGQTEAGGYHGPMTFSDGLVFTPSRFSEASGDRLAVIDVAAEAPRPRASLALDVGATPMAVRGLAAADGYSFVTTVSATGEGAPLLQVVDTRDPDRPEVVARVADIAGVLASTGGLVFAASWQFTVVDAGDPSAPAVVATLDLGFLAAAVAVDGGFAYVVGHELVVIDVRNPAEPMIVGRSALPDAGQAVAIHQDHLVVLTATDEVPGELTPRDVIVYDVSFRPEPQERQRHRYVPHLGIVHLAGQYALVPFWGALQVFDMGGPPSAYREPLPTGHVLASVTGDTDRLFGTADGTLWAYSFAMVTAQPTTTATPGEDPGPTPTPTRPWDPDGPEPLHHARSGHTVTMLADGRVMVSGGCGQQCVLDTVELFDPATGRWRLAAPMPRGRYDHQATLLTDGTVLVTGGNGAVSDALAWATRYDPARNMWLAVPSAPSARWGHHATRLTDGRVLLTGGYRTDSARTASAELYDPVNQEWQVVADAPLGAGDHTTHALPNGRVLVMDGLGGAALFDPAGITWRTVGPSRMNPYYRSTGHTATLLPNGLVLRAGGSLYFEPTYETTGSTSAASLFDPSSGTWRQTAEMPESLYGHLAVLLADGRVLVAGGSTQSDGGVFIPGFITRRQSRSYLFDPATESWSSTGDLRAPRFRATGIALADGSALLIDGDEVESFDPVDGLWKSAARPVPQEMRGLIHLPAVLRQHAFPPPGEPVRLTDGPRDEMQAAVSPDGQVIAYLGHDLALGVDSLRFLDRRTGATIRTSYGNHDPPFFDAHGAHLYLPWYASDPGADPSDRIRLWRYDVARSLGAEWPGELVDWPLPPTARRPALSPDGRLLAYDAETDGASDIFVMDLDIGSHRRLTDYPAVDRLPMFSPDGQHLVFRSERDGNSEIYRIGVDGQGLVRLTDNSAFDTYASYSPDGSSIVFQSDRGGTEGVYVMRSDGSAVQTITDGKARYLTPRFMPDGQSVLLSSDRAGNGDLDLYLHPLP